ncbi:hypothetical protein E2320_013599 [Naja naja]|nr:hypothetical protein E2320_013599 [Naja naja]
MTRKSCWYFSFSMNQIEAISGCKGTGEVAPESSTDHLNVRYSVTSQMEAGGSCFCVGMVAYYFSPQRGVCGCGCAYDLYVLFVLCVRCALCVYTQMQESSIIRVILYHFCGH